jgi:hypothetical protein
MSIVSTSTSKTNKNFRQAAKHILGFISDIDYGYLTEKGISRQNTEDRILAYRRGERAWVNKLPQHAIIDHFKGDATVYFSAHPYNTCILVMLDIDCKKAQGKGSPQGALACANWLSTIFPNLYHEPSTNGNGRHGYIILDRDSMTPKEVCDWLKKLQSWLQSYQHHFDIEMIEVKGQPMRLTKNGQEVTQVTCGTLAKIPREIVTRWEEFTNTTQVNALKFAFPDQNLEAKTIIKVVEGSIRGKHVQDPTPLIPLAKQITRGQDKVQVNKNVAVTPEDISILLAILYHCTNDINADGSMPTRRIQALWESMYQVGDIQRQWNPARYSAARNLIEEYEGIVWEDQGYTFGRACKWKLNQKVMDYIKDAYDEAACISPLSGTHTPFVVGQPQAHPFEGVDWSKVLGWKPQNQVIVPEFECPEPIILPTGEEMTDYLMRLAA